MPSPYNLDLTAAQINTALNNAHDSANLPTSGSAKLVNSDKIHQWVTDYVSGYVASELATELAAALAAAPLATEFESAEFPIPANDTTVSVEHGLGVVPKLFKVVLVCKQNVSGWVVGDETDLYVLNADHLVSTWADTTNIGFQKDDNIYLVQRDGTGRFIINESPNFWRLKARAWV